MCILQYCVHLQIGAQFENENEDDLKDQMDFMQIVEAMPGLRKGHFLSVPTHHTYFN